KKNGLVSLGSTYELIGPYQGFGAFVRREWARSNASVLERYLAAYVEAQRWLLNPANERQVTELMGKEFDSAPEIAAETYQQEVKAPGGYQQDAQFDVNAFKNVLKLRADVEGTWGGHPPSPEKYYDPSYYNAALKKLRGNDSN